MILHSKCKFDKIVNKRDFLQKSIRPQKGLSDSKKIHMYILNIKGFTVTFYFEIGLDIDLLLDAIWN